MKQILPKKEKQFICTITEETRKKYKKNNSVCTRCKKASTQLKCRVASAVAVRVTALIFSTSLLPESHDKLHRI